MSVPFFVSESPEVRVGWQLVECPEASILQRLESMNNTAVDIVLVAPILLPLLIAVALPPRLLSARRVPN